MKFKNYLDESRAKLYMFSEAFDTPQKIQKQYSKDGFKFYEFYIGDHEYRIVLDIIDDGCDIIFERFYNGWKTQLRTNDLSTSEVLNLFSTVVEVSKLEKLNKLNYIQSQTDDLGKSRIYIKLFKKMLKDHSVKVTDGPIYTISAEVNETEAPKFRYKK